MVFTLYRPSVVSLIYLTLSKVGPSFIPSKYKIFTLPMTTTDPLAFALPIEVSHREA